jgi:hypothetical protein
MMRRLRTLVLIISVLAFAVVGGVAVASALLPTSSEPVGQDASRPAGTSFSLGAAVDDPAGGPQWAVRIYPSKTGWTCAEAGRTAGKRFGRLGSDGEVVPVGVPELGSCADVDNDNYALWVNHYPADGDDAARAVVFGAASAAVHGVTLTVDGSRQQLPVTGGAFLDVLPEPSLAGAVVTVTLTDGSTHDTRLRPGTAPVTG